MDSGKISSNINILRSAEGINVGTGVPDSAGGYAGGFVGNRNNNPSITKSDIIDAITTAMDGLVLSGGSTSEETSSNYEINALISALKNIDLNINIAK